MIFDDHDVRDDWNTSWTWRQQMEQTPWWHGRIVAGLASYWVYQHLGNLSAAERAEDEIWQRVVAHEGPDELDLTEVLDQFAERVDQHPETYRWSYCRDFDTQARLVVIDSRAARDLRPDRRALLDQTELDWVNASCRAASSTSWSARRCPSCWHGASTTWRRSARPLPGEPGAEGQRPQGRSSDRPWTSSTGLRSRTPSTRSARWSLEVAPELAAPHPRA